MTATEAKWSERVREWRASGKTAAEFASASDLEASTLRYWASRLKTQAANQAPLMARVVRRRERASMVEGAPDHESPREVEVRIGEARIVVRAGFDADLLRQVAMALKVLR
jgi:transposase